MIEIQSPHGTGPTGSRRLRQPGRPIRRAALYISGFCERHASPDSEPAAGEEYGGGDGWAINCLDYLLL